MLKRDFVLAFVINRAASSNLSLGEAAQAMQDAERAWNALQAMDFPDEDIETIASLSGQVQDLIKAAEAKDAEIARLTQQYTEMDNKHLRENADLVDRQVKVLAEKDEAIAALTAQVQDLMGKIPAGTAG